jgi:hypothetical protein
VDEVVKKVAQFRHNVGSYCPHTRGAVAEPRSASHCVFVQVEDVAKTTASASSPAAATTAALPATPQP